jgi:uncharacterized protein YdhG (YjbR/CyaY superfamily)
MDKPANVDAYLAGIPANQRAALESLRQTIQAASPQAVETISYGIPTFKYRGRPLASFGAAKNHCALYGMPTEMEAHREALARYDTSKGTLRFPADKGLPKSLVRSLVKARMADVDAAEAKKGKKPAAKRSG